MTYSSTAPSMQPASLAFSRTAWTTTSFVTSIVRPFTPDLHAADLGSVVYVGDRTHFVLVAAQNIAHDGLLAFRSCRWAACSMRCSTEANSIVYLNSIQRKG